MTTIHLFLYQFLFFFFQAEDGIRDYDVTGVQTCALPIYELFGSLRPDIARGVGVELRIHGRDPDEAEAAARTLGYHVLAGAMDKPHGLREAYIVDQDGYVWVPDVPVR